MTEEITNRQRYKHQLDILRYVDNVPIDERKRLLSLLITLFSEDDMSNILTELDYLNDQSEEFTLHYPKMED